jgi:SPP1 family predicted phage head-tail adaptor
VKPRIGKLRHRLALEAPSRVADGGGGAVLGWTELAQLWGAVESPSGGERVGADRVAGERQAVITIRYREGLAPAMRLRSGGRVFPIRAVLDPDGRRRYLRCLCEERDL